MDVKTFCYIIIIIVVSIIIIIIIIIMPPTRKGSGGIMFSGVRPSGNLVNKKSQEPLGGFLSYLAQGCTMTSR